jgi:hypothetical protein
VIAFTEVHADTALESAGRADLGASPQTEPLRHMVTFLDHGTGRALKSPNRSAVKRDRVVQEVPPPAAKSLELGYT